MCFHEPAKSECWPGAAGQHPQGMRRPWTQVCRNPNGTMMCDIWDHDVTINQRFVVNDHFANGLTPPIPACAHKAPRTLDACSITLHTHHPPRTSMLGAAACAAAVYLFKVVHLIKAWAHDWAAVHNMWQCDGGPYCVQQVLDH